MVAWNFGPARPRKQYHGQREAHLHRTMTVEIPESLFHAINWARRDLPKVRDYPLSMAGAITYLLQNCPKGM